MDDEERIEIAINDLTNGGLAFRPAVIMAGRLLRRAKKAQGWQRLNQQGKITNGVANAHGDALAAICQADVGKSFSGVLVTFRLVQPKPFKLAHASFPGGEFFI